MPSFRHQRWRARSVPAGDAECGWLETLPPLPRPRRLEGAERCDVAVVGAGFTGLAAARRLAELAPGARIVVLEAQRAGSGASGRSSGFVVDLAGFIAAMPEEHSRRFIRLSRAGIADLRGLVSEHDIDCDWNDRGFLHVAAGETGLASLATLRGWLDARGEAYEWLDRNGMTRVTGSSFYRAGLRLPGSVLVQAGALVRGLAATLPAPVEVFEESPVRAITGRGPYRLASGRGSVVADRLVLALNGYSSHLGLLSRRVFPLLTFGSLTRPLTAAEAERLGGESEWGVLAQDPMGSTVRRTRDQRLLIRNYLWYGHAGERQRQLARQLHRRAFLKRFPHLEHVDFEYTWQGLMGISLNHYPFFGRLDRDGVGAAGFTACGIAMGTICGRLLADLLLGVESPLLDDLRALPGPRWIPPQPFRGLGIRIHVARMNASAGGTP